MAKKKAVLATFDPTLAAEPTTTLSTRLSSEQKQLIEEAAQLQSWTPSNLMRKAAVERSAHIVNTGRPTQFAFATFAERLASQLCSPELWVEDKEGRSIVQWPVYDDGEEVKVASLALHELNQLREAIHLGGVEFMEQVVDACQQKLSDAGLPDPIDPSTLE